MLPGKLNLYCIFRIFSNLHIDDVFSIELVNKDCKQLVDAYLGKLSSLDIDECNRKFNDRIVDIIKRSPNLLVFKYSTIRLINHVPKISTIITQYCKHIEHLNLVAIHLNSRDVQKLNIYTNLKTLVLNAHCRDIYLLVLIEKNSKLQHFGLWNNLAITGRCLKSLPNTLKTLELSNNANVEILINIILQKLQLKELCFKGHANLRDLVNIKNMEDTLEKISIRHHRLSFDRFSSFKKIKSASFNNAVLTDESLEIISQSFVNLETLKIKNIYCGQIFTPAGFLNISKMLKLTKLVLSDIQIDFRFYIYDAITNAVQGGRLEVFRIKGCLHFDDDVAKIVLENCPKLTSLEIVNCPLKNLFAIAVDVLNNQKERTDILKIKIFGHHSLFHDKFNGADYYNHPLLEIYRNDINIAHM